MNNEIASLENTSLDNRKTVYLHFLLASVNYRLTLQFDFYEVMKLDHSKDNLLYTQSTVKFS